MGVHVESLLSIKVLSILMIFLNGKIFGQTDNTNSEIIQQENLEENQFKQRINQTSKIERDTNKEERMNRVLLGTRVKIQAVKIRLENLLKEIDEVF